MKTDKFDDAIRRKLESIEPPFRERDWSHLQAFMHHHGYPPAWAGASQWLVPLGAAAAVTGLIFATVWQFRTNQELSQSLQTLSQTVARLEATQAKLIERQTQTDTVYVTNFTETPASRKPGQSRLQQNTGQPTQRGLSSVLPDERYARQPVAAVQSEKRPVLQPIELVTDQQSRRTESEAQSGNLPGERRPTELPVSANQFAQRSGSSPQATNPPTRPVSGLNRVMEPSMSNAPTTRTGTPGTDLTTLEGDNTSNQSSRAGQTNRFLGRSRAESDATPLPSNPGPTESTRPYATARSSDNDNAGERSESATLSVDRQAGGSRVGAVNRLAIRPVAPLSPDSAYYAESLAKRTRRIRSLFPVPTPVVPAPAAPTDIASSRPASGMVRLRLGISGETGYGHRVMGAYSELVIDQHWAIGIGLNQIDRQGGQYGNYDLFKRKTKGEFPRVYGPGTRPIYDIVGIDQQFALWQVPINLSYRALLGKGFAFVPSVGIDINASARQTITFLYRHGPYERYTTGQLPPTPYNWFNAYTISLGAERSWKHIVLQAGPVVSAPTRAVPEPINSVTLGLRARVLLQF